MFVLITDPKAETLPFPPSLPASSRTSLDRRTSCYLSSCPKYLARVSWNYEDPKTCLRVIEDHKATNGRAVSIRKECQQEKSDQNGKGSKHEAIDQARIAVKVT